MAEVLRVDPDGVQTFTETVEWVAAELDAAAAALAPGADRTQIAAGLGALGSDFADEFVEIVAAHRTELTTAAALVRSYGQLITEQTAGAATIDGETAEAVTRAGADL